MQVRVETGSGYPGEPDYVLSELSKSNLVYIIFKSDQDSALIMHVNKGVWSNELSMFDSDDESVSPDSSQNNLKD